MNDRPIKKQMERMFRAVDYITAIAPAAQAAAATFGIPASYLIAEALMESSAGQFVIRAETHIRLNDSTLPVDLRKKMDLLFFEREAQGLALLYPGALQKKKPRAFAMALYRAGYADRDHAEAVAKIIADFNLTNVARKARA